MPNKLKNISKIALILVLFLWFPIYSYPALIKAEAIEGTSVVTTTNYIHADHLGGTNVVTDASGVVVQTLDYYPFGEMRIDNTSDFDETKKFTGHEFDRDSNLTYAKQRYYSQDVGKWLSQDPVFLNMGVDKRTEKVLQDPQLANAYSYGRNNPVNMVDSEGEFAAAMALPVLTNPVGAVIGGVAILGAVSLYYGTQVILQSDSWGSRYGGQVQTNINDIINSSGLNQNPTGPEDWNPKNLPNLPKWVKWVVGTGIGASRASDIYQEVKGFTNDIKSIVNSENSPKDNEKNPTISSVSSTNMNNTNDSSKTKEIINNKN